MFTDEDGAVEGGWAWAQLNHRGTESKEKWQNVTRGTVAAGPYAIPVASIPSTPLTLVTNSCQEARCSARDLVPATVIR